MILITDSLSAKKYENLIKNFGDLYENGFPDPNEREIFSEITARINKKNNDMQTIIALCVNHEGNTLLGGMIVECFKKVNALLLSYIIVSPLARKQGIANKLINEGTAAIIQYLRDEENIEIKNHFFESNNPSKTKIDNFAPKTRLKIFSSLGARIIPITYVQPSLGEGKKDVENLSLFSFCQFNVHKTKMLASDVKDFLREVFQLHKSETNPALNVMEKEIELLKKSDHGKPEQFYLHLKSI
jgi:hypothetical protein